MTNLSGGAFRMALGKGDAFNDDQLFAWQRAQDNPGLSFVLACNHFYFVSFFYMHTKKLNNFRSERYDGMPASLGEFARHGTENTVPFRSHRLALLFYEHDRVLIKADIRAVLAGERLHLPHHDRAINIFFLYRLARFSGLYGNDDDIANTRIPALGAAEYFENPGDLPAGIICNCNDRSGLQHTYFVGRELEDVEDTEATERAEAAAEVCATAKRFNLEIGLVATMVTVSPTFAVLPGSCARYFFERTKYFLYFTFLT